MRRDEGGVATHPCARSGAAAVSRQSEQLRSEKCGFEMRSSRLFQDCESWEIKGSRKMKLYLKLCNESLVSRPEYSFILFRRKNAAKYGSPDGWVYLQYPVQTIPISIPYPIQCLAKTIPNRVSSHSPYPPYILPFEFRFECLVGQGGDIGSLTDFDGTVADIEDCVDVLQKDVSEDTDPTS